MISDEPPLRVERLFPFVLRSRALLIGRETLSRNKSRLQFVLMTRDISDNSKAEILADFAPYPIVQCYTAPDLEKFFRIRGTKVVGFEKSGLAKSIYAELKDWRVNKPAEVPVKIGETPVTEDIGDKNIVPLTPGTGSSVVPAAARPRARWDAARRAARRPKP